MRTVVVLHGGLGPSESDEVVSLPLDPSVINILFLDFLTLKDLRTSKLRSVVRSVSASSWPSAKTIRVTSLSNPTAEALFWFFYPSRSGCLTVSDSLFFFFDVILKAFLPCCLELSTAGS